MIPCPSCGGILYRHGVSRNGAQRYRCRDCHKCCTMRNGAISQLRGRPFKVDQRFWV